MNDTEKQELLDAEHLRLLRLGYLVAGFTNMVFALFPLIHVTIGLAMLLGAFPSPNAAGQPFPRFAGLFFVILGGAFSLMFATGATLKLLTARRLRERRSKVFCMITAGLSCLGIPYGTVLGVATFLVLGRPSVSALFDPPSARGSTSPHA
jgi:branched-subunit amino acid ABC-type transport system permease component